MMNVHLSAQEGISQRLACRGLQSLAPGSLVAACAANCLRHCLSRVIMQASGGLCQDLSYFGPYLALELISYLKTSLDTF